MNGLLDVVAIVQAKPGGEEAVGAALARCAEASRREAGCQWYRLHKDRDVAGRFVVIERWRRMRQPSISWRWAACWPSMAAATSRSCCWTNSADAAG